MQIEMTAVCSGVGLRFRLCGAGAPAPPRVSTATGSARAAGRRGASASTSWRRVHLGCALMNSTMLFTPSEPGVAFHVEEMRPRDRDVRDRSC